MVQSKFFSLDTEAVRDSDISETYVEDELFYNLDTTGRDQLQKRVYKILNV